MNIKGIVKKASVIIMISSILSVAGCSGLNERQTKQMTEALEEKYGIEFKAAKIGNRWNQDSATIICYPKDNPELMFKTTLYKDGTIWEGYMARAVGRQVEDLVNSKFKARGIDSQTFCGSFGVKPSLFGIIVPELQDVIDNYEPESFTGTIILPDSFRLQEDAAKIISEIYEEIYKDLGKTRFGTTLAFIADEEFEKASQDLRLSFDGAGDGWFWDYTVTSRFNLRIDDSGNMSSTRDEIIDLLRGDK